MSRHELEGKRLSSVTHTFLNDPKLSQDLRDAFVNNTAFKDRRLEMKKSDGAIKLMGIDTKLIDLDGKGERRMLLVINDLE